MYAALLALLLVAAVHGAHGFGLGGGGILSRLRAPAAAGPRVQAARSVSMLAGGRVSVGIVGATGAVGEEILKCMEQRSFPANSVKLYASEKSSGKVVKSGVYGELKLEAFDFESAKKLDVLLLAVGGDFSLEWAEKLAAAGVLVIDNSSAFRMKDGVPLVVPEINIAAAKGKKLIANPNCTTAIALM